MSERPAWQFKDDGLEVWVRSEKVATIPRKDFKHLLADLAVWLQYRQEESNRDGSL